MSDQTSDLPPTGPRDSGRGGRGGGGYRGNRSNRGGRGGRGDHSANNAFATDNPVTTNPTGSESGMEVRMGPYNSTNWDPTIYAPNTHAPNVASSTGGWLGRMSLPTQLQPTAPAPPIGPLGPQEMDRFFGDRRAFALNELQVSGRPAPDGAGSIFLFFLGNYEMASLPSMADAIFKPAGDELKEFLDGLLSRRSKGPDIKGMIWRSEQPLLHRQGHTMLWKRHALALPVTGTTVALDGRFRTEVLPSLRAWHGTVATWPVATRDASGVCHYKSADNPQPSLAVLPGFPVFTPAPALDPARQAQPQAQVFLRPAPQLAPEPAPNPVNNSVPTVRAPSSYTLMGEPGDFELGPGRILPATPTGQPFDPDGPITAAEREVVERNERQVQRKREKDAREKARAEHQHANSGTKYKAARERRAAEEILNRERIVNARNPTSEHSGANPPGPFPEGPSPGPCDFSDVN